MSRIREWPAAQMPTGHEKAKLPGPAFQQASSTSRLFQGIADNTQTDTARFLDVANRAYKSAAAAANKQDEAEKVATARIEALNSEIRRTLEMSDPKHGEEIRRYVAAIKDDAQRTDFILEAVRQGDRETLGAIFSAKPYLSGMSAESFAALKNHYIERHAPELLTSKASVEEALEVNRTVFDDFLTALGTLFPKAKLDDVAATANKAKAVREAIFAV